MTYKEEVEKKILPKIQKDLGITNALAAPKVLKITVSAGIDAESKNSKLVDLVSDTIMRISGQKPVSTKAKKSVSGFKVREGMVVGVKVTLRGKRMYDFLQKLIHIALPRVRDFRGIEKSSVDATGNLSLGFKEHLAFPEIHTDEVEMIHGLEVTISTSAKTHERGVVLFKELGFPFSND